MNILLSLFEEGIKRLKISLLLIWQNTLQRRRKKPYPTLILASIGLPRFLSPQMIVPSCRNSVAYDPNGSFFSECSDDDNEGRGFVLRDVPDWTEVEHEQHFRKFFTELHGLALSRFYIGVRYTNVTWWVYFMRPQIDGSVIIVDRPDKFRSSQSYLNYL
mmetsp:Transcript_27214/g.41392  ORF Transcript_27214/g.41392 Transcript_27214/m.41392 type:complete len:160 (+) Transcript_27214:1017-1496(+)